ncbi:MAG: sigma-54 dependent transcriptional regulator [Acidobacteriota bacterium]|jgi:two-component system response regulator GlrR
MVGSKILLVQSASEDLAPYGKHLEERGFDVVQVRGARDAIRRFSDEFAVVVSEVELGSMDGSTLLQRLHQIRPETPVILLADHGKVSESFDLIEQGAYDYVQKSEDFHDFTLRVGRALQHGKLAGEVVELRRQLAGQGTIVPSSSPAMLDALHRADAVATTDYPVLLSGESGTGKELVARQIHLRSERQNAAFLAVNCGAIPKELFESQLFGHRKGSFTGAGKDQAGLFQEASGGTLFLDEVGEIAPEHQVKLLRVLEQGEIRRVGETEPRPVDVRIVGATNQDLAAAVSEGSFREDLFYRLNVVSIVLPPLRERPEDLMPLARSFLESAVGETGKRVQGFSGDAERALRGHSWPGNIRELQNRIRQALIVCQGDEVRAADLFQGGVEAGVDTVGPGLLEVDLVEARRRFERRYLEELLRRAEGNVTQAARLAGKHRSELYTLLKRHSIRPDEFRGTS